MHNSVNELEEYDDKTVKDIVLSSFLLSSGSEFVSSCCLHATESFKKDTGL